MKKHKPSTGNFKGTSRNTTDAKPQWETYSHNSGHSSGTYESFSKGIIETLKAIS